MIASWERFELRVNDDVGVLFRLGRTLADAGLLEPGVSIWFARPAQWRSAGGRSAGRQSPGGADGAITAPSESFEIYLSPMAAMWLAPMLHEAGYQPEACAEPDTTRLELLIGHAPSGEETSEATAPV